MSQTPSVTLRDMVPGEEKALLRAARLAFVHSPLEQIGISSPKHALVAEVDGALAGAMFLKIFESGGKRTGYLDVGFVSKAYRGHGVGRALYPAAAQRLRDMGCERIGAMVIDDNVASWKSLQNQGFGTPSLTELAGMLGFVGAASLWLRTMLCFASGTRLWISGPVKARGSARELLSFLWVNMALYLPALLRIANQPERFTHALLAFPTVLLAGVLFGGIGCLVAGGAWRFSFPRGGSLCSLLFNASGGAFPMVGRWYLRDPRATPECRRAMGIQAAVDWIGTMALFALGAYAFADNPFVHGCATIAANLLVYRLIPFMPFGAFGGARVWAGSKIAFAVLAIATIALLVPVF